MTLTKPAENPVATATPAAASPAPSRLWLWFVAAFVVQAAVWTVWITLASKNRVAEVPLATARAGR